MVKIDWQPEAAKAVLGLATADQRRIVDAVEGFRWRIEDEARLSSGAEQYSMTAGNYDVRLRVLDGAVEVQQITVREEGR
ncbi:hypothetical protein [Achromobacter sp. Root565]|uniref:hypothetical protein n=1 Tax=Achromobacter sp. Root565 TaxID=1736564 RepID=UPI0007015D0C|nr:hypothetical protein [Achromobacter sp. Root565]KQZ96148.1 hypothetical protein ASD71_26155 [Achromobacter sp. Root565]